MLQLHRNSFLDRFPVIMLIIDYSSDMEIKKRVPNFGGKQTCKATTSPKIENENGR
jgi:hypothetical protein